ncbi:MAG: glutamate racemase [Treponematales bacterium]
MNTRPVVFLDSGIGSLPYYRAFAARNPGEPVRCVADRANFPYGPEPKERLCELLASLTGKIVSRFNPQVLVLACNTATVSALAFLRGKFPALTIVGTVPAVKPAVEASLKRRVGVLGTERTIADPYIRELAARYGADCVIQGEAAPELVDFVERHYAAAGAEERLAAVRPWVKKFRRGGVDAVVLGCTHFLLLVGEFKAAAAEAGGGIGIYDSVEGITKRIESFLDTRSAASASGEGAADGKGDARLVVTGGGKAEPSWRYWAGRFGLTLEVWR